MARLVQTDGANVGVEYDVREHTSLGRSTANTIAMDEKKASRHHAVIRRVDGRYVLVDLGSKNGTYVNGGRYQARSLRDEDVVRVGKTIFKFHRTEDDPVIRGQEIGVGVVADEHIDVSELAGFDVGRLLQDTDGMRLESSAAAEVKIGPALRAARTFAVSQDEQALCHAIVGAASSLFEHVDRCVAFLVDDELQDIFPRAHVSHVDEPEDIVVPFSVLDAVRSGKRACVTPDARKDLAYDEDTIEGLLVTISFVAAPLATEDGTYGVIYADTVTRGFYFTEEDLHLMVLMGALGGEMLAHLRK